jgi:hypothetical protein
VRRREGRGRRRSSGIRLVRGFFGGGGAPRVKQLEGVIYVL